VILVDTSIWIDHLRHGDERLSEMLDRGEVLMHPFVVGEIALGNLLNRKTLLDTLQNLPQATIADNVEVMQFIERQSLFARGIGYLDAHLLAATRLTSDTLLWTRDKRLLAVATALGLSIPDAQRTQGQ
jgi:predicted nucleic acid-binding protein